MIMVNLHNYLDNKLANLYQVGLNLVKYDLDSGNPSL